MWHWRADAVVIGAQEPKNRSFRVSRKATAVAAFLLGASLAGTSVAADVNSQDSTVQRVTVGIDGKLTVTPQTTEPTTPPTNNPGALPALYVQGNKVMADGAENWMIGYNSFTMGGGCGSAAETAAASQANSKAFIDSMRHDGHGVLRLFYWSGYSAPVKSNLQELVNYAGSKNVYVILTLSDGQKGCGNAGPSTLNASDYGHVKEAATRFKDNPTVAFFEVANEPTSQDWSDGFLDKAKGTTVAIKAIDSDRLVGSGTQASYLIGSDDRQQQINAVVDVASLHGYEENNCDESRTKNEIANAKGKPVIMGEFNVNANSSTFAKRTATLKCKLETWKNYDGFAAALGWAWQPGNGGTANEYGNLDADAGTQALFRTASLG